MDIREISTTTELEGDAADAAVRAALADRGFGVLTEIDIAATLKNKLGIDRPPLKILGACNPGFAHQALEADVAAALVLPCNVVLEPAEGGGTRVSVVDPRTLVDDPGLAEMTEAAAAQLAAALDAVGGAASASEQS